MATKDSNKNEEKFDVVIIGGGAAGLSAALWCDELKLKALLLEENRQLGGQLFRVYNPIENHLGTVAKNGEELRRNFAKQIKQRNFITRMQSRVTGIDLKKKQVILETKERIAWRFLIIATGIRRRVLGVSGEERFKNKGIIDSGKRDEGKQAKNKKVVIIGGGDAALENALILAKTASEVTVVHHRKEFKARTEFLNEARKNKKIKFLTETVVKEFKGDKKLESLELQNSKTKKTLTLPAEVVLLRIGVVPNTEIFHGKIKLDERGYIIVGSGCETSSPNIFAVGDVANPLSPTVSSAVGMGATAVKNIRSKAS